MDWQDILPVFFRWMHIIAASLVIGGLFFLRVLLPAGLGTLDTVVRQEVFLRIRRLFKMLTHACILLLLVSGVYNTVRLWPIYGQDPAAMHGLWGGHVLLALAVFAISLWLLAGNEPPASHRRWVVVNLVLLLALVALASALRLVRERHLAGPQQAAPMLR